MMLFSERREIMLLFLSKFTLKFSWIFKIPVSDYHGAMKMDG